LMAPKAGNSFATVLPKEALGHLRVPPPKLNGNFL